MFIELFRFILELIWLSCFFLLYQIGWVQWKMEYSTEIDISIFHVVAYMVTPTLIYFILVGNCSLPLWILACIVHSPIHGFVKDFNHMNHFRGITIHLIKIWDWIFTHLVNIFSLCTVWHLYWVYKFYK